LKSEFSKEKDEVCNTESDLENQNFVIFEEELLLNNFGRSDECDTTYLVILGLKVFLLTDEIDSYDISYSTTVYILGQ
jgi:hypothetical protein